MSTVVLDTETCGLHGPIVLAQYAFDDGDVQLHDVWSSSIDSTLELYERFCESIVIGFNLAFDWFHICQQGTTLLLLRDKLKDGSQQPKDHIDLYAECERDARDGPCFRPFSALDLMLHARKGAYQSTMDRKPIRIKKVPKELAQPLVALLDKNIKIPEIYFSRKKEKTDSNWRIDSVDTDFVNLELKFAPSTGLKELCKEVLDYNPTKYGDISIGNKLQPIDVGWAPFAYALSNPLKKWRAKKKKGSDWFHGFAWPGVIEYHINHWRFNAKARQYAIDDVVLTSELYKYFGKPEHGDKDSILACMVGAVRWRGYSFNEEGVKQLRKDAILRSNSAPKDPAKVYEYIVPHLTDSEKDKLRTSTGKVSTKKVLLEEMSKWKKPCLHCLDQISVISLLQNKQQETVCEYCKGTGELEEPHPVALRAKACLDARQARTEVTIWDKLLQAGRFHASFNVIGAFSARMSGTDGLNAQGINRAKHIRKQFTLAFGDLALTGGDFSAFEVSIADAICDDPKLRDALRTCEKCKFLWPLDVFAAQVECPNCGKTDKEGKPCRQKFHGVFGQALTDGKLTYDQVLATKGSSDDLYDKGKRGGFSQFYGGNWNTLVIRLGVSEETARAAEEYFLTTYKGVGRWREGIKNDYCSMRQDGGIGTKVTWVDPKEFVTSLTGHRRYFTLENMIAKSLYQLSTNIPEGWKKAEKLVVRSAHKGPQKLFGAAMSALIAAAFNLQSSVMRAAANHIIQSTGAELTKMLQMRLWELQPVGINKWHIQPMNIHDEIMCPSLPSLLPKIKEIIKNFIIEYSKLIPLLAIDWSDRMETWAEK